MLIIGAGMVSMALLVVGILVLTNTPSMIQRVAAPGYPHDAALHINLGTAAVTERVCNGRVPYDCDCCDCGDDASKGPQGTDIFSNSSSNNNNNNKNENEKGLRQQQHSHHTAAAVATLFPSTATATTATTVLVFTGRQRQALTLAENVEKHPNQICECGATLHFDRCPTGALDILNKCPVIRERLASLSKHVLAVGICGILYFAIGGLILFLVTKSKADNSSQGGILIITALICAGLAVPSYLGFNVLGNIMTCTTDCCPGREDVSSLQAQGFVMTATTKNSMIASFVFCVLGALYGVVAGGFLMLDGGCMKGDCFSGCSSFFKRRARDTPALEMSSSSSSPRRGRRRGNRSNNSDSDNNDNNDGNARSGANRKQDDNTNVSAYTMELLGNDDRNAGEEENEADDGQLKSEKSANPFSDLNL